MHLMTPIFKNDFFTIAACDQASEDLRKEYFDTLDVTFEIPPQANKDSWV